MWKLPISFVNQAPGLAAGLPGKYDSVLLTTDGFLSSVKDSGFSSRVSEVDVAESAGKSLLADQRCKKDLTKRLARISECQHGASCFFFTFCFLPSPSQIFIPRLLSSSREDHEMAGLWKRVSEDGHRR